MAIEIINLPDIGEGITEGEMVKWLVNVGDAVEMDQPIAEVMTDKATVEVPSTINGVVKELKVQEGDMIPIESAMLTLETSGGGAAAPAPEKKETVEAKKETQAPQKSFAGATASPAPGVQPPLPSFDVLATPSTRRLAREMNVDINQIKGTGLAGRVTREDILGAKGGAGLQSSSAPATAKKSTLEIPTYQSNSTGEEEREPIRGIRRKIVESMQLSKQVIPHFTIMDEANLDELVKVRQKAKEAGAAYGVNVTYLPFVMKAVISACKEFPMFNASIDDANKEIVYKKYFNLGFAADTPNGLMVPVIKDADKKSILQLSKEIYDLAMKARDGKITAEDMRGATITVTNIGAIGGTYATPIINHPQVAIIGMYKLETKPVFIDGEFQPTKIMNFTATADHRLIDGAVAAKFLKAMLGRLENPAQLMIEMI